jgi:hypothetical protein
MRYTFIVLTLLLASCSPKLVTNYVNTSFPMVNRYESFGIVDSDTVSLASEQFIGQIEVKDNGLSINCDYWTVLEQIKNEARKTGGNLIRIDEHKKPSTFGSSCHQIKASVFRVDNPRPFEKLIYWNSNRKLAIDDFKGPITNRPFQAATFSGIEYYIKPKSSKGGFDIVVRTQFDCFRSYFKPSDSDSSVLAHEQLHFDIAEIYARRFFQELLKTQLDPFDFSNQANKLLNDITTELSQKQDEYDSEVYKNPELQEKWNSWVSSELEKYSEYRQKEIKNHGG